MKLNTEQIRRYNKVMNFWNKIFENYKIRTFIDYETFNIYFDNLLTKDSYILKLNLKTMKNKNEFEIFDMYWEMFKYLYQIDE